MKKILVIILCTIPVFCILADNWQGQQGSRRFYLETDYTAPGTALTLPEFWIERAACDSMSLSGDSLDLRFNRGQIVFKDVLHLRGNKSMPLFLFMARVMI